MRFDLREAESVPCAEYRARMRTLLAKRPYFQATVAWWGPDSWHDEAVTSRAIANEWPTLEQLFSASDDCRVFGEARVENVFGTKHRRATDHTEWPAWAKPAGGRKLGLEVRSDAGAKREFMSVALVRGVALCLVLDPDASRTSSFFQGSPTPSSSRRALASPPMPRSHRSARSSVARRSSRP